MKGLTVDKKQIPLIFGLLAVIAAILVYFFIYQKYQEKITQIEGLNSKLQGQIDDLTEKVNSRDFYESEVTAMQAGINKAYDRFPPAVEEEDGVMEAMKLESIAPMQVASLDFQDAVNVYTVGGGEGEGAAPPEDIEETGETTIEQDVAAAQAGETTNYSELQVPDLTFSPGTLPPGYQGDYGPIALNVNVVNVNFMTSYEGIKRTLTYFVTNPNRRTVQNISMAFNQDTGLLTVSAIINEYSLTGTGKVYEYPMLPYVNVGTSNIFGTAELGGNSYIGFLGRYFTNMAEENEGEDENNNETETQQDTKAQKNTDAQQNAQAQPTVVTPTAQ